MNHWIDKQKKKKLNTDLANIADEALSDDGFYGGMEAGVITEDEAERTYNVLLQFILRVSDYIESCPLN